jgi:hypothetical protein
MRCVISARVPSKRARNGRKLKGAGYVARRRLVELIAELHHPTLHTGSTDSVIRRSNGNLRVSSWREYPTYCSNMTAPIQGVGMERVMRLIVARCAPLTRLFNKALPQGSVLSGKRWRASRRSFYIPRIAIGRSVGRAESRIDRAGSSVNSSDNAGVISPATRLGCRSGQW